MELLLLLLAAPLAGVLAYRLGSTSGSATGASVGYVEGYEAGRRSYLPTEAVGPLPEPSATHIHDWHPYPYLLADAHQYHACKQRGCGEKLRKVRA